MPLTRAQATNKASVFAELQNGIYSRICKTYNWNVTKFDFTPPVDYWLDQTAGTPYDLELDCSRDPCDVHMTKSSGGHVIAKKLVGSLPKT